MKSIYINFQDNKMDAAIECLWLITIFIIPLYFNPYTLNAFYFVKSLALVLMVSIISGLCLAQLIIQPQQVSKALIIQRVKGSPLQIAAVIYGVAWIISTIFSVMPYKSLWGNLAGSVGLLPNISWIIFFIILTLKINRKEQIFRAIYALLLSSGIVSLVGILQYIDSHILPWFRFETRVFSTDGNPLYLSGFLAMVLPITLAMIILTWYGSHGQRRNITLFTGLMFLFALQLACLALAQYSLTLLLFIVGIFSFFALIGLYLKKSATIALSVVFLIILVIIAGILLGPMLMPENNEIDVGNQSAAVATAEQVGLPTLSIRVDAWRCAANVIIQSPEIPFDQDPYHGLRRIIGYGPETFIAVSQTVFPSSLRSSYTFESLVIAQPEEHYLYLGATVGIFGLLVFISLLVIFAIIAFKALSWSKNRETIVIYSAFIAAILQYCVHIFFNASVIGPELVFWTVMGLTVSLSRMKDTSEDVATIVPGQLRETIKTTSSQATGLWRKIAAILIVIAFAGIGLYLTVSPLAANMKIQSGLMMLGKDKSIALALYQDATKIEPRQSYYWNFAGNLAYIMAEEKDDINEKNRLLNISENAYLKAIEQEPQMAIWYYRLADIDTYWAENGNKGKYAAAYSLYEKADRLFPGNAVILNKWAFASILNGDYSTANEKLEEAERNDPLWIQTAFFKGLLQAERGNTTDVGNLFLSKSDNPFKDIRYYVNFCSQASNYGRAPLIRDSLRAQLGGGEGEWLDFTFLAISNVYCGNYNEAVDAFKKSADMVDSENKYLLAGTIDAILSGNSEYQKAGAEIISNLINKK